MTSKVISFGVSCSVTGPAALPATTSAGGTWRVLQLSGGVNWSSSASASNLGPTDVGFLPPGIVTSARALVVENARAEGRMTRPAVRRSDMVLCVWVLQDVRRDCGWHHPLGCDWRPHERAARARVSLGALAEALGRKRRRVAPSPLLATHMRRISQMHTLR